MAGNAYWKNRQARLMYGRMDDAEVAAGSVSRIYAKASAEITRQMRDIFQVYQDKWNLTEKEARRLLSIMDGGFFNSESLRRGINTIADEELRNQMLRDLETPAYQARLRRLQELQEQLDQMMVDVYQQDRQMQTEHYIRTGTDTYYRGIYDVQRQVGFQFSFAHIDQKTFDRLLKSKWSGKNFSSRIWDNTQQVADTVKEELLLEMLTGKTLEDCAEAIQYRFQVGAYQSRRLIRTESNFVSGQMQLKAYEECDAEYYEYVATLDSRTDEECGRLDGKRFKVSDARPGVNFHPMHPFCRCSDIIALDDDMKAGLERRARDPKTGKLVKVPASTNYMQWAKDNGLEVKQRKVVEPSKSTESRTKVNESSNKMGRDVTKDYFELSTPGKGTLTLSDGYTITEKQEHDRKMSTANILVKELGGDIVLLEDRNEDKVLSPDYYWKGALWDLKTTTTEKSANSAIRHGLDQIKDNPGGIILNYEDREIDIALLESVIGKRMQWRKEMNVDIVILQNDKVLKIIRYGEK